VILLFKSADPLLNNRVRPVHIARRQIRLSQDRRRKGVWLLSAEPVKEWLKPIKRRFGVSFRHAVISPRIVVFLLIGLVIFALITFWPLVVPYLARPGMAPLGALSLIPI